MKLQFRQYWPKIGKVEMAERNIEIEIQQMKIKIDPSEISFTIFEYEIKAFARLNSHFDPTHPMNSDPFLPP
jgi:hypothetical protein